MLAWLGKLIAGPFIGALLKAYQQKLAADNDEKRIIADAAIADIQRQIETNRAQADVIKTGMQSRAFWIPWLMAAVPLAAWFAWGVLDTMLNGALPDVATLPGQLKEYADTVWQNIFYSGAAVSGASVIAAAIRGRK